MSVLLWKLYKIQSSLIAIEQIDIWSIMLLKYGFIYLCIYISLKNFIFKNNKINDNLTWTSLEHYVIYLLRHFHIRLWMHKGIVKLLLNFMLKCIKEKKKSIYSVFLFLVLNIHSFFSFFLTRISWKCFIWFDESKVVW